MHITNKVIYHFACIALLLSSCKDFVTIKAPFDQVTTETVYKTDETASAAIRGIYSTMMVNGFASGSSYSVSLLAGRSSDEFTNFQGNELYKQFSNNDLLPDNANMRSGLWTDPYRIIYAANSVIENLGRSNNVSPTLKSQLTAEAKFIRAFCHFYLTNLFGDVPMILTTDYRVNSKAFASQQTLIYKQIISDLIDAKTQLSASYINTERIRANKWAAAALLARVYLYAGEWANADTEASEVISQSNEYTIATSDLNNVFLKNSKEAILQFYVPENQNVNTNEGRLFILNSAPGTLSEVVLSEDLLQAFEPGDLRRTKWIGTFSAGTSSWHYPFKYKVKSGNTPSSEYSMVLRLAEQYLIRAEARINQNKIADGIADLNVLRARARATPTTTVGNPLPVLPDHLNKADALRAVERERRIELFSEWGHRWLDLKRTNRADAILGLTKGSSWQSSDALYPIPASELINDHNLKQNPGY